MGCSMASSLALALLLLLLESTIEAVPYQQCCPEDDQHIFIENKNICKASKTLGLLCSNDSNVDSMKMGQGNYWLRESDGSATVFAGLEVVGFVVSHDSYCVANVTSQYGSYRNGNTHEYDDGIVICKDTKPSGTYLGTEPLGYTICLLISGIGCFLTFVTYILVPALWRDLLNKCIVYNLLCFTILYLSLGINIMQLHWMTHQYCSHIIIFTLFWSTATVFWTNVVSFHIWRTTVFERFPINEARLSKVYHFWGWGIPLILTCIAIVLEAVPIGTGLTVIFCHIKSSYIFVTLLISYPFLFFFNLLYFIWVIIKLWRQEVPSSSDLKLTRFQRLQYKFFMHLKLFVLMGMHWIVHSVLKEIPGNSFAWILLNTVTLLHGLFVFLLLVAFQKKVLLGLAEQLTKCPFVTSNAPVLLNEDYTKSDRTMEAQKDPKQTNAEV